MPRTEPVDEIRLEDEILMVGIEVVLQRIHSVPGGKDCVFIDYRINRFSIPDFDLVGPLALEDLPRCLRTNLEERVRHIAQERLHWPKDRLTTHLGPEAVFVHLNS